MALAPGDLLGKRYRVEEMLGRGGMGEVWLAYDLKLRLEVALKTLHSGLFESEEGLELLRAEVRAAREVVSPNVCRLFDLVEVEGRELVSMEYVDGVTLLEHLRQHGPLDLKEANEIASQLLAGLDAIHRAGLVHRDIKPENTMLTRAGRVVIMDFGLTSPSGTGSLAGTPAYMAPEQARGEPADARADVFSAGVVLAEMLSAEAGPDQSSRQTFWVSVRRAPPEIPESPWRRILERALAPDREERYASAQELSRALEEVAFRVEGAEHEHPYPGLASFRQEDAEFFFGREAEVEAVWKKLTQAPLLGLIGPSGSGKSSFLNAGLLPARPEGWSCVRTAPGSAPFAALARALLRRLADDPDAMESLVALEEPSAASAVFGAWRGRHEQALLIVDQFEELFTQCSEDVQRRFVELLGRVALDLDVHVLLSMRDDFLMHCRAHDALAPLFGDLTALLPPMGSALRRAVVQPALRCGYRFEDESVVESMLQEVAKERGVLPLIAFTAAELWERRDRETGHLTREAYESIGGVGGALAQHAEATLEGIGPEQTPIVRELLRNLVTAQGTRAARDRDELLSVFDAGGPQPRRGERGGTVPRSPSAVLDGLIDARLLTAYEVAAPEAGAETRQQVEIVHESLLKHWPRLVRWRTQDSEGAQLRDELRHQARLWDQHGRAEDYLWSGTAYREFQLWRERYAGGLSALETAFAEAMVRHAERRTRRRRAAITALFVVLAAGLTIVGTFWRRAVAEAQRAEAATLYALAQNSLDEHPSSALAYAMASLERQDSEGTRRLALDALWRGPTEIRLLYSGYYGIDFSSDGNWLAVGGIEGGQGGYLQPADGGPAVALEQSELAMEISIGPRDDVVVHQTDSERLHLGLWSLPDGRLLRQMEFDGLTMHQFSGDGRELITSSDDPKERRIEIRSWPLGGGPPRLLARLGGEDYNNLAGATVGPSGTRIVWLDGRRALLAPLDEGNVDVVPTAILEHDAAITGMEFSSEGDLLATVDEGGTLAIWKISDQRAERLNTYRGGAVRMRFSPENRLLAGSTGRLWNLSAPRDFDDLPLPRPGYQPGSGSPGGFGLAFHPVDPWLATGDAESVSLWPLAREYPLVIRQHEASIPALEFSADGRRLYSCSLDGSVRSWPLPGEPRQSSRVLFQTEGVWTWPVGLAADPLGRFVAAAFLTGHVRLLSAGEPPRERQLFSDVIWTVDVSPEGRRVAAGSGHYVREEAVVRVWDLETDDIQLLDAGDGEWIQQLEFVAEDRLLVASGSALRLWNLGDGSFEVVEGVGILPDRESPMKRLALDPTHRLLLKISQRRLILHDLHDGSFEELAAHGDSVISATFDASGQAVLSVDAVGIVRVGPVDTSEPHLLLGHEGPLGTIAVSPDGQWIASAGRDKTIRLWKLPDSSAQPLHSLPRDGLLAKLATLTNLRAVEDAESPSGYSIEVGAFPGWERVPTW